MKFIHIADVHIGATPDAEYPWAAQREQEILRSFQHITHLCNEQEMDLLLIAGDLFHRQPLIRELKEINYYFAKLRRTQVVFIAGNHDYIGARSNYLGFEWNSNVHMLIEKTMDSIYLEEINTEVYGFSYHMRDITEPRYNKVYPSCEERINILLAHGGDEKNIPIDKKELLQSGFDYIALGHIHKPEIFGEHMAYSGSLEPMDKNEIGPRGYIYGEMDKEGELCKIHLEFVPNSIRQYIKAEIKVDQGITSGELADKVRELILENGVSNLYILQLTGIRDADILFSKKDLISLGNIIDVIDQTVPDYDFDALYEDNQDNIIGFFIKSIRENGQKSEISDKALYYGIEALLNIRK